MEKQLQPFVEDRVNGWAEKGIKFQMSTVDRGVSVEEWLEANQEFTTTTKKYKKTVINEKNKTTTITTTKTKTTTTRASINMRRDAARVAPQTITSGELRDGDSSMVGSDIEMETRTSHNYFPSDIISSKKFDIPRGRQKQSTPDRINRKATPQKVKRLSPKKIKLRNREELVPTKRSSKSSECDSGMYSNDISDATSRDVFTEVSEDVPNDINYDHENVLEDVTLGPTELERTQKKNVSQSKIKATLSRPRPQKIVVYSPGAGKRFGKRIDDEFMSVTRTDLKKGIDPKYHKYTDFKLIKKCIVPVKQKLVYAPPIDMATKKNSNNDDSETDDDLLTSYTTTGHFYRINSK